MVIFHSYVKLPEGTLARSIKVFSLNQPSLWMQNSMFVMALQDGQYVQTLTEKLPSIFGAQAPIFGFGMWCRIAITIEAEFITWLPVRL